MHRYAKIFIEESNGFNKSAGTWFTASMLLLGIVIIFGMVLLFIDRDFVDKLDVIQFSITKILVLTALFYGVNMCFKNYKAHKHNEILNKHRHNALLTFEAFTGSKEDQQTKRAVLLAATQTIFGSQNTGYNDKESSDSDLPTKIIEIIKTPTEK